MRFMVLVKAAKEPDGGALPGARTSEAMGKFNEELSRAGVLLDLASLHPSSKGARVPFGGARTVIDGPFAETKELVAGYWVIQAKTKEEAIEWFKRCPTPRDVEGEIEIRQVFEPSERATTAETQVSRDAAAGTPDEERSDA
ncbi:MAG: YciI family protein [Labilithrix sp.]|nr:YciI family protein [Labilithrix sp.]MCW5832552.1 YciI family protein [Labilithrix sp.]